jgi:TATA-box binding protein (TBP) (component of TFIID and TFIIIB)
MLIGIQIGGIYNRPVKKTHVCLFIFATGKQVQQGASRPESWTATVFAAISHSIPQVARQESSVQRKNGK